MNSLKAWLIICALLLIGVGGAFGFLAGRRLAEGPSNGYSDPFQSGQQNLIRSEVVWDELGLGDDQKDKLEGLLATHYRQVRDEAARAHSDVLAVLTPEQRKNLEEIEQRYVDERVEDDVLRKMAFLRRKVGLPQEKEADVYKIFFDAYRERHAYWRQVRIAQEKGEPAVDRKTTCRKMEEMHSRMEGRLGELLGKEWLSKYQKERRESKSHRRRGHKKDGDKDKDKTEGGKPEA